ncbi:class I SAM-dependent DNA methyltransferase [Propionibacteriaceae bacterium Y1685]
MPASDALVVVEDWISEHYFTTDARGESFGAEVLKLRKRWDDADESVRSRFTAERPGLVARLARVAARMTDRQMTDRAEGDFDSQDHLALHDDLRRVLGYATGEFIISTDGPISRYQTPGVAEPAPLVIIDALPAETPEDLLARDAPTLSAPWVADELADGTYSSVGRALSRLFVDDDRPEFALVLAGRWLVVTDRDHWPEGRYLAVDLQTVAERNDTTRGGELDRALACVGADSLAPDADGTVWWSAVLEASRRHAVGVSADLREGVRRSIEIIANEVVDRRRERGWDPLPPESAQPLAIQSLRYLYRILFLLYAEASPELGVLPVGATEYDAGYSLDRLRELTQVPLATPHARTGTHLYASLAVLFDLVDRGHGDHAVVQQDPVVEQARNERVEAPLEMNEPEAGLPQGLVFHGLRADLFARESTSMIDETKLGNEAVQRVLQHLMLSKEQRGKERGFISYVALGINQLGAVYEGLMSYTGSFATTDLYEVARDGDNSKGSWLLPIERADDVAASDVVTELDENGEARPVHHPQGSFVFRLSGRDRQQSASYYTPEVLTRFTVSQALAELLDQGGRRTTAEEILGLSVCEPALGSGAFAIEAVRQLAEQYLSRREHELGARIDADQRPHELRRAKAAIALHQVYGVDLNATAVELAEISLWLDTMAEGLRAPWFGLRLRRGNSLVGARHAMHTRDEVVTKNWLTMPPADVPLTELAAAAETDTEVVRGRIHHFLLPAAGWGATTEAKEARTLAPERTAAVKAWRKRIKAKPSRKQLDQLSELAHRVDVLWRHALRRLTVAEQESRRAIPLWGRETPDGGVVTREEIEAYLDDPRSAYQRLRLVMDAWCALWWWPLHDQPGATETTEPPDLDAWIAALQGILGRPVDLVGSTRSRPRSLHQSVLSADSWEELAEVEALDLSFAAARPVEAVLAEHPWLEVCRRVAAEQGFFHWELDFAPVFARGGFDLQVGNPPWVRPDTDIDALLAETDPWWALTRKPSEEQRERQRARTLEMTGAREQLLAGDCAVTATREAVSDPQRFPVLAGLRPDLYRCFMAQTWRNVSSTGVVGLIHPETHFTDERAARLREATYRHLRRHWQFVNELQLFEVDHHVSYGVHVYGRERAVGFLQATALYHPDTAERSLAHDGSGSEPGFKDDDGRWDQRPHGHRIIHVTDEVLATWHAVLEDDTVPVGQTRMLYTVNRAVAEVLDVLASAPRLGSLGLEFSAGWNEKTDRQKGRFGQDWGAPSTWREVILQGPHLHVNNPLYKVPNKTMKHNQDWSPVDLERLAPDTVPITAYKPAGSTAQYDAAYTHWGEHRDDPARDHYRVAWRRMAANTGERTLIPAIIPPGAAHVNAVFTGWSADLPLVMASLSSVLCDFSIRSVPKGDIYLGSIERLPRLNERHALIGEVTLRTLRLNCLTDAYAELWEECWDDRFTTDAWTGFDGRPGTPFDGRAGRRASADRVEPRLTVDLGDVGPTWTPATPLRRALDRRQAQVEIDALVALMLGVTADQLCTVYRTQFAVLRGYDRDTYYYDANGRLVPTAVLQTWRKKGDRITPEERRHPVGEYDQTYELPFATRDREADLRHAYAVFEQRLAEHTEADRG